MKSSVYLDGWDKANTARNAETVDYRRGAAGRSGVVSFVCLIALVAMVTALPAGAQSLQDLMKKNEALVKQNQALMEQNRQLMEMVQKNATRIQKLETTVTSGGGSAAPTSTSGPLEARVKNLETKQAALDKRSGSVVKSGSKNVRLNISGQINRGVLIANDGDNTDVFHVDNDNSSSRFRFVGEADLDKVTAGTVLEAEFESNSTANVNQNNESNSAELKERKIEFFVKHSDYGKLSVGQGDTASNNTAEVDLSGTGIIGYSSISDMSGGILFFDDNTGALSSTKIGSVSTNFDGLGRDDRLRYDTPKFYGFSLAASTISNDKWDLGLFYSGKYGTFKVAGAFGYAEPKGSTEDRIDGSLSVLHDSGVNLTFAAGRDDLKSGDRDPWSGYAKIGYLIDWNKRQVPWMARIGKTAFAVDYHRTEDQAQNDDEFQSIGFFVVQAVDQWAADLYVGVRWHDLDREGSDFDSIVSSLVGARFKF